MYTKQPKKLLIMNILDILRKYSDDLHPLSQKDIEDKLEKEYGMTVDRKAVKRNLMDLIDFGYEINYTETVRRSRNAKTGEFEESSILTDFYLLHEFTDAELRLLIDGLLFSRHVPWSQCCELVGKLEGLSNNYFRSRVAHISKMPEDTTDNKQIFLNIELLDEAITKKKKVSFRYMSYGTDKKLHPRRRSDGSEEYLVSPYQMAAKEGKYYLICNLDKYDNVSNYRLDRIKDIKITDEPVKKFETLEFSGGRPLDLADYMEKHVYMFSSPDCRVKMRVEKNMLSDVIDLFGRNVTFSDETDGTVTVSVNANEMSVERFAQNFAPQAVILEPKELAEKVKEGLIEAVKAYEKEGI